MKPVTEDGEVRWFDVTGRDPADPEQPIVRRARNSGRRHRPGAAPAAGHRAVRPRLAQQRADAAGRPSSSARAPPVAGPSSLGAGQSAAEAVDYLHRSFPDAEVCSVFAKYGYTPADDSPFANRIFDPEAVDDLLHGARGT